VKGKIQALDEGDLKPEQITEIATRLNVSEEEVVSMNRRLSGDASLNAPIRATEGESGEWQDWLVDEHDNAEEILVEQDELESRRAMLSDAMSVLNERERRIFEARRLSEEPLTLEELSGEFDISRERVRQIEVRAFEKRERISAPFPVGPITIQPGDFSNRSHDFTFESNASRPVSGVVTYGLFDYWSGERRQLLFSTNVHPAANLSIDFIYTHNTVDHPAGAFATTTLSNRVLYAFTTDLFVKSYIQWNDLDQRVSANVLLGWEYRPGSEIYLVYDESRDRFDRPNLAARNRMLLAKCTYKFRF
jgi:hypothetical protein